MTELTITQHAGDLVDMTLITLNAAAIRILPHIDGSQVAYIGNGYVQAADIDDLITVLQAAKQQMTDGVIAIAEGV